MCFVCFGYVDDVCVHVCCHVDAVVIAHARTRAATERIANPKIEQIIYQQKVTMIYIMIVAECISMIQHITQCVLCTHLVVLCIRFILCRVDVLVS